MCAACVAIPGGLALVGWALDIDVLKSGHPSFVSMKANAAVAFVLLSASLWLMTAPYGRPVRRALATAVCLIGLATVTEYLLGIDLHIDELLFADSPDAPRTSTPGRMAPTSALSFLLVGLSVLLADVTRTTVVRQALVSMVGAIALLALSGYVFGASALSGFFYTAMAVHTSVGFLLACMSVFLARPTEGCMSLLSSDLDAAWLARRLLPAVVLIPILIGWLEGLGESAGLYDSRYGLALVVLGTTAVLATGLWTALDSLQASELSFRRTHLEIAKRERELQRLHTRLEQRFDARTEEWQVSETRYRTIFGRSPIALSEWNFSSTRQFLRDLQTSSTEPVRERLRARPDLVLEGILKVKVLELNQKACELFGVVDARELQQRLPDIARAQSQDALHDWVEGMLSGELSYAVSLAARLGDRSLHLRQQVTVLPGHETDWSRVVVSLVDVTADEEAKLGLREDVDRRELLLREIHHRVKNNLAMVSSLFYLQSASLQDERSERAFKETQRRVRSMSLVHETLYRSDDLSGIDFADYVRLLAAELMNTQDSARRRVRLTMALEPLVLNIDQAVPCGLILSELVSNALKHAFPDDRPGEISVTVSRTAAGEGLIRVSDDGVGLPSESPPESSGSLGLRLVKSLAQQVRGEFALEPRHSGTEASMTFALADSPRATANDGMQLTA